MHVCLSRKKNVNTEKRWKRPLAIPSKNKQDQSSNTWIAVIRGNAFAKEWSVLLKYLDRLLALHKMSLPPSVRPSILPSLFLCTAARCPMVLWPPCCYLQTGVEVLLADHVGAGWCTRPNSRVHHGGGRGERRRHGYSPITKRFHMAMSTTSLLVSFDAIIWDCTIVFVTQWES